MPPGKRNEFLDASDSEDDQVAGYDSDEDLRKGGRNAKRRKVDSADEDDEDESEFEDVREETFVEEEASEDDTEPKLEVGKDEASASDKRAKKPKTAADLPDVSKSLTKKNLVASEAAIKKSGVVYLSRIPPFMKPAKLRSLLEPYGKLNRIFLTPEDPTAQKRRVRAGGNKKKTYTEGWVEFIKKKDAKAVCELLNAQIIGGKKGNYYHDDLWNLLYLKGFKWHHLTEQITSENAERTSRMRAEISKTTKENKEFVRNVERAKMLDGMQSKSKKRKNDHPNEDEPTDAGRQEVRTFKQASLAKKRDADGEEQPERVTRVLSKIF